MIQFRKLNSVSQEVQQCFFLQRIKLGVARDSAHQMAEGGGIVGNDV